eukprot:UN18372
MLQKLSSNDSLRTLLPAPTKSVFEDDKARNFKEKVDKMVLELEKRGQTESILDEPDGLLKLSKQYQDLLEWVADTEDEELT